MDTKAVHFLSTLPEGEIVGLKSKRVKGQKDRIWVQFTIHGVVYNLVSNTVVRAAYFFLDATWNRHTMMLAVSPFRAVYGRRRSRRPRRGANQRCHQIDEASKSRVQAQRQTVRRQLAVLLRRARQGDYVYKGFHDADRAGLNWRR